MLLRHWGLTILYGCHFAEDILNAIVSPQYSHNAHLPNAGNNHWGQVIFDEGYWFYIGCEESIRLWASYLKDEFHGLIVLNENFWKKKVCSLWFSWH